MCLLLSWRHLLALKSGAVERAREMLEDLEMRHPLSCAVVSVVPGRRRESRTKPHTLRWE